MKLNHPTVEILISRTTKVGECLQWNGKKTRKGYGRIMINRKETYTHRAMIVAKTGNQIPDGMCVLHSCDNPSCINPDHLRIGTHKENSEDMMQRGRGYRPDPKLWSGTNNPKSVLSNDDRLKIIELMKSGMSATEVSEIFPVSSVRCGQIRKEAGIKHTYKRRCFRPMSCGK